MAKPRALRKQAARPTPAELRSPAGSLPARMPTAFQGPPEIPPNPDLAVVTMGMPLRYNRAASLFIDDPLFQELRGPHADRTLQRMLADPIIAGTVERTSLYLRAAEWNVVPGGPAPIDKAWSDFVNDNLQNLGTGFRSTIANMADAIGWGFSLHETLFEQDGNAIRWADFSPREQRTVRSWYVEPGTARLKSVVQLTDQGLSLPIPAWKLLHFRTHPASGRPEGRSLVRNAFLPWTDKQELRRITKLGLRRDFTGVAKMEIPARNLTPGATPAEVQARQMAETLVRDFERDEREGLVVPSSFAQDGVAKSGWDFSLVQSAGRRQIDFDALFAMLNQDILIALLSEYILLGSTSKGSFALASVKATLFGRAITSWLDMLVEILLHALEVLQAFNPQFAAALPPIITHGDIDEVPLSDLGTFLQAVAAGGFITPDPEVEKALRRRADLPQVLSEQEL